MNNYKDTFYNCIISRGSRNGAGGYGEITAHFMSAQEIIDVAEMSANDASETLYDFAGIKWVQKADYGFEPERDWKDGEQLETAVEQLRHDGHLFEYYEHGVDDGEFNERCLEFGIEQ